MLSIYSITAWITSITSVGVGILVYLRNTKAEVNKRWAIMTFCIAFWSLFLGLLFNSKTELTGLIYSRLLMIGAVSIPVTYSHFILSYLGVERQKNKLLFIGYFITSVVLIIDFSPLLIKTVTYRTLVNCFYPEAGPFFVFFMLFYVIFLGYSLALLFMANRTITGQKRNQIKYIVLASVVGFLGGASTFPLWYKIELLPIGSHFVWIYSLTITIAILRYRLMDINIALTRAGIFVFVYALVLGIPFWVGYEYNLWKYSTWMMFFMASLGPFVYSYLRHQAENIMLKEQHRYQKALKELSATLTLMKDLERLIKLVIYRVARAVKLDFACIYLADYKKNKLMQRFPFTTVGSFPNLSVEIPDDSKLLGYIKAKRRPIFTEELNVAISKEFNLKNGLIIPSFVRGKLLGFLLLGPKSTGMVYTQADVSAFEILANQTALAIENSEFIEESQRTQAQLFAAERMASMGAMAGGMSHQINNRFHAIAMATSDTIDTMNFLHVETYPQEAKDYFNQVKYALHRIQENAKHGGKIVNDFLNFSQPARMQRDSREFHLREPLERAIEMVRIKTTFPEDTISIKIEETLPKIEGDFVLIQDVFFNLLDNAIDAIKTKGEPIEKEYKGSIDINMKQQGAKVEIKIKDNGTGMTDDSLKKVFVPFFTTKATANKGTGLGLFVIQKIVHAHQGEINLSSIYAEGTTFTITLPIAQRRDR